MSKTYVRERFDEQGRELLSDRPVRMHLGKKPAKPSLTQRIRQQVDFELRKRQAQGFEDGPVPTLDGDDFDVDEEFGQSPHEVVETEDGRYLPRGEALLERERAAFDEYLAAQQRHNYARKRLKVLLEEAAPAPKAPAEPKPARPVNDGGNPEGDLPPDLGR